MADQPPHPGVTPGRADLLALVEQSPAAVAAHDRDRWLGLFTEDAVVNDPVGSVPHVGPDALGRFYDTFIAPNSIAFRVERDLVCGGTVVRDLSIETTMPSGVVLEIPMHLRYDVRSGESGSAIAGLFAHWQLPSMVLQLLRSGRPGLVAAGSLGPLMLRTLGLRGTLGFSRGFFGTGARGRRTVTGFLESLRAGGGRSLTSALTPDARLEYPAGTPVESAVLLDPARNMQWGKMISAGRTVSVSIDRGDLAGVAFFELAAGSRRIAHVRWYSEGLHPLSN